MSNQKRYEKKFGLPLADEPDPIKVGKALEHALDIRKFEIELYWKRAGYFWALIAVAFAGFFSVAAIDDLKNKDLYIYAIANFGFVLTWAWILVNRGSKYWQENWENHVDMLEDSITGPLYKTILRRPYEGNIAERLLTGPAPISVSKVNQWVSAFTLVMWGAMAVEVLPEFRLQSSISWARMFITAVAVAACFLMCWQGKTHQGHQSHRMQSRRSRVQ